ncbi:MAG TPA: amidase [Stellaceae bacterium]|jgi:aspartyl-tRNA(Asn)/glutamyl-tRNA(Gln) amidotransferase subunit A|nr:amidase [Stellaceae bacterium]
MIPLHDIARRLAAGETSSTALIDTALSHAQAPDGEGHRVFTRLYADRARADAAAGDRARQAGRSGGTLAGLPISIKDLFDVAGETTWAGSTVLRDALPAKEDAAIVARLRAAGAIIVGKTNMTEFAFSGLGLNPHYGTPLNPYDRATGRIPGGSSSGAGVSVTDGMAAAAIGTDTGGSVRIPAALTGLVGFKPTQRRVPLAGAFPLSPSLDSIGPLAPSVACCALLDSVLAGATPEIPDARPVSGLRLAAPQRYVLDDLDRNVAQAFAQALARLSRAGATITEIAFAELEALPGINRQGGIVGYEAYAIHAERMARRGAEYDPRVLARIRRSREITAAGYEDLRAARRDLIARAAAVTVPFDAVVLPSVAQIAPALRDLEADDSRYGKANLLMLRNPGIANFLDRCAITIPCHAPGAAPVGLMLMGEHNADRTLLALARGIEACLLGGG